MTIGITKEKQSQLYYVLDRRWNENTANYAEMATRFIFCYCISENTSFI